jgi:hypothetical protein
MTEDAANPTFDPPATHTVFDGARKLGSGPLWQVAVLVRRAMDAGSEGPVQIFEDTTGRPIDIDLRGSEAALVARLSPEPEPPRGRGRPKLGVVAREVTLLPRHWDWLKDQPGGASVALRKLVDEARRASGDRDRRRAARDAAYRFMSAIGGDLPGFEEASRALYADDRGAFAAQIAGWPQDIRDHAVALAFDEA